MQDQYNFQEDQISQNICIAQLPLLYSSRQHPQKFIYQKTKLSLQNFNNNILIQKHNISKNKIQNNIDRIKQNKQKKLKQLQADLDNKLMAQCTFKPKTNKNNNKRNLNQFLKSQYQHAQKILLKTQLLKQNIINSNKQLQPFKPKINNKSKKSRQQPVHQRLYKLRQKQKVQEQNKENGNTFKPTIHKKSKSIIRNMPVGDLLYQDALRRTITKKQNIIEKQQKLITKNPVNERYAAQKFIKQYYYSLEELNLDQEKEQFNLVMFESILKKLGFIRYQLTQDAGGQQKQLTIQAYELLKQYFVDARNICVFLMGLLGIYYINPINFENQNIEGRQDFNLDETEGRKLQKYFDRLFRNRLSSQAVKKPVYVDENPYKPQTNIQSNQMAQRHRQRMIESTNQILQRNNVELILPDNGNISHVDLLAINKIARDLQLQRKRQQKQNITDPQCTFKPKTQKSQKNTPRHYQSKSGMEKSNQLYNHAKKKKQAQDAKLNPVQNKNVGKSKNKNQNPINRNKKSHSQHYNKDIEKNIARMYEGRQKRQQKMKYFQRGQNPYPKKSNIPNKLNNNLQKSQNIPKKQLIERQQKQQPVLVIDVNMGDQKQQIQLYRGDQNRLVQIVQEFCFKFNLDHDCKEQLLEMLNSQVQNILNNIDQDR